MPEGLKIIQNRALYTVKLTSLYIPKSVNEIRTSFIRAEQLKSIVVNNENPYFYDVDDICIISKDGVFLYLVPSCGVTEFSVPEGVVEIGEYAFSSINTIEVVNLPSTLEVVKTCGFAACNNLRKINTKSIVNFDGSITGSSIKEFTLNYSIVRTRFVNSNLLERIIIADTVTTIRDMTLENCRSFETLIFEGTTPPTFETATLHIGTTPDTFKIYVPDSAVSVYKAVPNLANYKDRIFGMSELNG